MLRPRPGPVVPKGPQEVGLLPLGAHRGCRAREESGGARSKDEPMQGKAPAARPRRRRTDGCPGLHGRGQATPPSPVGHTGSSATTRPLQLHPVVTPPGPRSPLGHNDGHRLLQLWAEPLGHGGKPAPGELRPGLGPAGRAGLAGLPSALSLPCPPSPSTLYPPLSTLLLDPCAQPVLSPSSLPLELCPQPPPSSLQPPLEFCSAQG